ncbi:MAG TPA: hypothetical protein VF188_15080 [Longimicrobiales bacterium]
MARHNREGRGVDQRGFDYDISYQPDWLKLIKVTRRLESGRQSTKILFRNPGYREQAPGARVRTRLDSPAQELDFEITVDDPKGIVKRVIVETGAPREKGAAAGRRKEEEIVFTLEDIMPPPPPIDNGDS